MDTGIVIAIATAVCSFIGNYAALRVHTHYLRRDVDKAHERIDQMMAKA